MTEKFIIVIEADNKRAKAAYDKGLADLALVWPQLMAHAERVDAKSKTVWQAKIAEHRKNIERSNAAIETYKRELAEWEKKTMFRGERPQFPYRYPDPQFYSLAGREPTYLCDRYESIRAYVQRMADLAGAAIGPYRMTEHQVQDMIRWENGSRVEAMMAEVE